MKSRADCTPAQELAGAIAIGEATEAERASYRAHIAGCAQCLEELGGEREIERVMATMVQARDAERWEPDLRRTFARRHSPRRALRWGVAVAAVAAIGFALVAMEKNASVTATQAKTSVQVAHAVAALNTQTGPRREGHAESLAVGSAIPLSTAFAVKVDRAGTPLQCTITKSSGNSALDRAVCRAALQVHY